MAKMYKQGLSLADIGAHFECSRQRVHQILKPLGISRPGGREYRAPVVRHVKYRATSMIKFDCLRCGKPTVRPCQAFQHLCVRCSGEHYYEGDRARARLGAAVKSGKISPAHTKMCVDCGYQAQVHDHRDYTKPLEVDPVCKSCNGYRGMAKDSQLRVIPKIFLKYDDHKLISREHKKLKP